MSSSYSAERSSANDSAGDPDGRPGQPLFESNATAPPPSARRHDNPDPLSAHPHMEQMLNATAKHVFPAQPSPGPQETGGTKDVSKEGLPRVANRESQEAGKGAGQSSRRLSRADESDDDDKEDKDPDQKPLMHGTPLDELKTPMFERSGGFLDRKHSSGPAIIEPGMSRLAIQEEDEETPFTAPTDTYPSVPGPRPSANQRNGTGSAQLDRPPMRGMGSVRMGTSALVSALNALPWEGDEEDSDSSDDDDNIQSRPPQAARPQVSRMHSSLHTIRPMSSPAREAPSSDVSAAYFPDRHTIPLNQQQGMAVDPHIAAVAEEGRRGSGESTRSIESDGGLPAGQTRAAMVEQIAQEQNAAKHEEYAEIERVENESPSTSLILGPTLGGSGVQPQPQELGITQDQSHPVRSSGARSSEDNVAAALREGDGQEEMIEDNMESNPQEKKRVRREKLAERLQEVFGLEEREEVLEEMRCWLLRSVMLKGYMYITPRHICFFAKMPAKENLIVKTGPLGKKASRTKLTTKYWAVLKNDVLSWHESTADPYFPKGNVSLQYASSCDAIDEHRFKLRTPDKNYTFSAETEKSRDEWIKAIEKVLFKTQHEGESVKIIIPIDAVMDIEKSPTLEFAETIEVKCVDPEDQISVDSYFFASFQDPERAMSSIQRVLDARPSSDLPRPASPSSIAPSERSTRHDEPTGPHGLKKIGSVLKPLMSRSSDKHGDAEGHKGSGLSIPFLSKNKPSHDSNETIRVDQAHPDSIAEEGIESEQWDGYPPRQSGAAPHGTDDHKGGWNSWIKKPSKIFGASSSHSQSSPHSISSAPSSGFVVRSQSNASGATLSPTATRTGHGKRESITEVVEHVAEDSDSDASEDDYGHRGRSEYSMMERSESNQLADDETAKKFRAVFSLTEKEELFDHFPGWLYRVLPVSGRFFISTNYFCFRSSQLLYKTKMIIPIRDVYGLKAQKAFRPGHSGLIIVIKGHEELFLEFSSPERRRACVALLEQRMEDVRIRSGISEDDPRDSNGGGVGADSTEDISTRIMEDLDEDAPLEPRKEEKGTPSMMFGSTTSTFLEFKPDPMRITCLTIGSRGDVQPYIALCKGLQAEGHIARIATHGEYKDWVEGHGIEFASVGGDPAELMQMCVDNGMFTVSFLKEGLQKFRGWLDDLLQSSWEACQGSELLIESPSAMGGIHIAEALRIPYYRAFTMPWTRTRAYPHAFAVPEHKRGGAYNYMTYTMFDQVFWRAIAGQVNRWRRKTMGIEATNFDKLEQHKVPFLYNFSPNVVPPPLDWTEWIHVTGYWFLENSDESAEKAKEFTPPDGLVDFIDNAHAKGKKVVYIGFGSIVVSDPEEMTRCVVEAVVKSGVCAILSKGWSDRGSKSKKDNDDEEDGKDGTEEKEQQKEKNDKDDTDGKDGADGVKYPPEIFPIDSIDHSWLFPRIDVACHHGGAGTSGASLRAGIPTIIKPFFGDQAFWSERVESLNVGSAIRKLTVEELSEALIKATTDEKQIAKAKIVGDMIRQENGVTKAIESIYRDLEYAKSIIKPAPDENALQKQNSLYPLNSNDSPLRSASHLPDESEERISDASWDVLSEEHEDGHDSAHGQFMASPERKKESHGSVPSGFLGKVISKVTPQHHD